VSGKPRRAARGEPRPDDALLPSPKDCMRSRTGRKCDRCGTVAAVCHVPTRVAGVFCPTCCPVCNGAQNATPSHGNGARFVRSGAGGENVPSAENTPGKVTRSVSVDQHGGDGPVIWARLVLAKMARAAVAEDLPRTAWGNVDPGGFPPYCPGPLDKFVDAFIRERGDLLERYLHPLAVRQLRAMVQGILNAAVAKGFEEVRASGRMPRA